MATYVELQQRHAPRHGEMIAELLPRLDWPRERVVAERTRALRELVRLAQQRSRWHADRLAAIDLDTLSESDMGRLPVMTKGDLMANWDAIVTDPRLTLARADAHLHDLETDGYLLDEFHVVASGGSSGSRGVFAYDWDGWARCSAAFLRWVMRIAARSPQLQAAGVRVASVAAQKATHMTSALTQTFPNPLVPVQRFPVTLPVREIVDGLNACQPTILQGYPSMLYELARTAQRGELRISPLIVSASSEPLLPEIRDLIAETWNPLVSNWWGTSEGGANGISCEIGHGMHLADDLLIIEPVDAEGRPVPPGVTSAKVYMTNLYNPLLPLIRYEITDEITVRPDPCPCGSSFTLVDDILGRADDCFTYGDGSEARVIVHPHVFRSPLSREPAIIEYQVAQTPRGARIAIRATAPFDAAALIRKVESALETVGLTDPQVEVARVDVIERSPVGKLKRFIPLSPAAVAS